MLQFCERQKKTPFHFADVHVIVEQGNYFSGSAAGMEKEHEV